MECILHIFPCGIAVIMHHWRRSFFTQIKKIHALIKKEYEYFFRASEMKIEDDGTVRGTVLRTYCIYSSYL